MDVSFQGPMGTLVGLFEETEAPLRGAAVVCHPLPTHGGTMRNTLVYRMARALRAAGFSTLRFNFRGVEGSDGSFGGKGEEEGDASAALDWLQERVPGKPLWAAGYSFGSRTVASLAMKDARIERLFLLALPVAHYDCSHLAELKVPGLAVFGSGDPFGTSTELAQTLGRVPDGLDIHEITGADHFFRGRTPLVEDAVREHALAHAPSST